MEVFLKYYQFFCGMVHFQWQPPCASSELVHFRKRIGEAGEEKIFQASVSLHGEQALEKEVVIDTTVQEKNITFPTDTMLRVKVMARCWKLAADEDIHLRRSYRRELKKTLRIIRFSKEAKDKKKIPAARRRIKTMANALLRDVMRKLPASRLAVRNEELERYSRVVNQERHDKNKIYSLHEPEVCCISKGIVGDAINLLMAAAAFNFRKWMNAVAQGLLFVLFAFCSAMYRRMEFRLEAA